MIKDAFDDLEEELEREIAAEERELQLDRYNEILSEGLAYLTIGNNENAICTAYEVLIYFLLQEEYERCAQIKKILQAFSEDRYRRALARLRSRGYMKFNQ